MDVRNIDISESDLSKLLAETLGLGIKEGSFLFDRKGETESKTGKGSTETYSELVKDPAFLKAARIIASPDFYAVCRIGGGSLGLEEILLHGKKEEGSWIIAAESFPDGSCTLRIFEDYSHFVSWWMDGFCGKNEEAAVNYIPPFVAPEEFLFLLHAIDAYRRVAYQNLLAHAFTEQPSMEFAEFVSTMTDSLKSKDIRWLLPAFLTLMPEISEYPLEMTAEKAEILMTLQFAGKMEQKDGKNVMIFGEAGKNSGVEFFRSWLHATGFELYVRNKDDFEAVERLFIAPTALANHFVRLQKDEAGKTVINHQAYNFEELNVKMQELFEMALTKE